MACIYTVGYCTRAQRVALKTCEIILDFLRSELSEARADSAIHSFYPKQMIGRRAHYACGVLELDSVT